MQPTHENGTLETPTRDVGSRFNRNVYTPEESTLNTASLETVYCMIALLQNPKYLFRELAPQKSFMASPISGGNGGIFKYQFVNEPELNYLVQLKYSLYCYFKRMFREAGRNVLPQNPHQASGNSILFRPNRVADVAKVWLQML